MFADILVYLIYFYTDKEDSISNALKQLQMTIVDDCNLEQKICAGSLNDEDDVCYGDSGGPLACREADGKWYLRGLTSYGPENCSSEAVFTKVAAYRDWFREKIASEVRTLLFYYLDKDSLKRNHCQMKSEW